jgi:hypothetical protein
VNHHLICMNLVLMRDVTSSVNTDDIKFSFVVRDEKGNVAHEEDFLPYGSTDDSSLMNVFNLKGANASDNGSILLNGTLVIDIVVHALPKESANHTLFNPFQRNMLNISTVEKDQISHSNLGTSNNLQFTHTNSF